MSSPVYQYQIDQIESSIRIARSLLSGIRDDLTVVQWSGADRERFHSAWESDVNAQLDSAASSVARMTTEAL